MDADQLPSRRLLRADRKAARGGEACWQQASLGLNVWRGSERRAYQALYRSRNRSAHLHVASGGSRDGAADARQVCGPEGDASLAFFERITGVLHRLALTTRGPVYRLDQRNHQQHRVPSLLTGGGASFSLASLSDALQE